MIILVLTLTAWALLHKYARQPARRRTKTACAIPAAPSPVEIERQQKESARAAREAERKQAQAEKARAAREQAKQDYIFYSGRLEMLYQMETDKARAYQKAVEAVNHDAEQNKYSYVIGEKVVNKHIAERDKLQKELLKLQSQIHGAESKFAKAKSVLATA